MKKHHKSYLLLVLASIGLSGCENTAGWSLNEQNLGQVAYAQQDYVDAFGHFSISAARGNTISQRFLAEMYRDGHGTLQNYQEALRLFLLAADKGDADAQSGAAQMYYFGQGVSANKSEAFRLWSLSARNGSSVGQYNLARMYNLGEGTPKDKLKSYMWSDIGATSGKSQYAQTLRDFVAKMLSPDQLKQAQEMANKCFSSNYKQCD